MKDKPKILVVSPTFPYPLVSGGKIRIFNILKQLSGKFHITLLSLTESEEEMSCSQENLPFLENIVCVPIKQNKVSQILRLLICFPRWLNGIPMEILVKHSVKMQKKLSWLLANDHYKAIQIEYIQGMQYLPARSDYKLPPVVLVAHDVSFVSQQRKYKVLKGYFRKMFWRAEAKRMKSYEPVMWSKCASIAAMSGVDRQHILNLCPESKVYLVPNGVNIENSFQKKESVNPTIIFAGWMRHLPNRDAVAWFIEEIWPLIKQYNNEVSLQIIGGGVPTIIKSLARREERVTFLGYVKDVRGYINKAWLSVVPIRIGSGSRLKILESMAMLTPIVSTTVGCEGLAISNGTNIAIADNSDEFARSVVNLLSDKKLRQTIADNAHLLVENNYSWDEIGKTAFNLLNQYAAG